MNIHFQINQMRTRVILIIIIAFFINSCKYKKSEAHKITLEKSKIAYSLPSLKNTKEISVFCWCFGQRINYGYCVTEMAFMSQFVMDKNQIVYASTQKDKIDSFIHNYLDSAKIIGVGPHNGVEARLVIKFLNSDSTFHTISFNEHSNHYIGVDDSVTLEIKNDPIQLLNRLTNISNIECKAN